MKVYLAGPYSIGDVALNVRAAIDAANTIADHGFTPYVPHLTHFWHLLSPKPYEWWLEYDNVWLRECDVVYRLPGESGGADREVDLALRCGIPVVEDLETLVAIRDQIDGEVVHPQLDRIEPNKRQADQP